MIPGGCGICRHGRLADIEAMLAAGKGGREVARIFGLPEASLRRHRHRCGSPEERRAHVAAALPAASAPPPALFTVAAVDPGDPIAPLLEDLRQKHEALSRRYETEENAQTLGILAGQLRNNITAQAKLIGQLRQAPDAIQALTSHPDWLTTIIAVASALEPFPEAREAVRSRLEAIVGAIPGVTAA